MRRGIVAAGAALIVLVVAFAAPGPGVRNASAATYEVNTTVDTPTDGCDANDCTLREAILAATANGDTITFNIDGDGPHTIFPLTNLPMMGGPGISLTIDGYTQPGASPNTAGPFQPGNAAIKIVIDGSSNTDANGHGLWLGGPGITVRGLSIVNADAEGIKTSTLIGGLKIAGNYIGILPDGATPGPNDIGIEMRSSAPGNLIGGTAPEDRNLVSGNTGDGIWVPGGSAVVVAGNWVGVSASGNTAVPNGTGIHLDPGTGSVVGGNSLAGGNLISGNDGDGVSLTQPAASNINVKANRIGTTADGISPLPNGGHGVYLATGAHDNTIGGEFNVNEQNIIAYNLKAAVALSNSAGANNYIDPNVMHSNGGLGADLYENGVTLNDDLDPDSGPNNGMNFPVIDTATYNGTTLTVTGTLPTLPDVNRLMFIFANTTCDPSGYGEGERFIGGATTHTNAVTGIGAFNRTLSPNPPLTNPTYITMSASDPESSSEFSLCKLVTFTNVTPSPTATPPTTTPTTAVTATPVVTPTETATPVSTPTHTPVNEVHHGDTNCDGDVNEIDMLAILLDVVGVEAEPAGNACPSVGDTYNLHLIGDLDCDGDITALDALIALLGEVPSAMLPLPPGCPAPGDLL